MSETLKLWFFRDLSDDQRLELFGLFGLPVDEIGKVHGRQTIALGHIVRKLVDLVREESSAPAPNIGVLEKAARALCTEHYADRFKKAAEDPHVQMNVEGNWHLFKEQARNPVPDFAPFIEASRTLLTDIGRQAMAAGAAPASNKRRPQQMYLKGFKQARDLAIKVIETVDTTDRSLLANALRAIHPPTKVRQKPEVNP